MYVYSLIGFIFCGFATSTEFISVSVEEKLRNELFASYDRTVRASNISGVPVVINVALSVTQLLDVDEKRQVITLSTWLYQIWKDYRLHWEPSDYEGIHSIPIKAQDVWYPDTAIYTSASEEHVNFPTVVADSMTTLVQYDGNITVCSAHIYEIPCKMDIVDFPFDVQSCDMAVGTWVHTVQQLDYYVTFDSIQQEGFLRNTEWSIDGSSATRYTADFIVFPGTYSYVTFTLFMRRKPLYYVINLILPCVLFSLLTVTVFFLPPNSADRITMGVSILLTLFVFNLLVADIMPATSENVPGLSLYLLLNMASVVSAIVISAALLSLYHKTGNVSSFVKLIFIDHLAKAVFVKTKPRLERRNSNISPNTISASLRAHRNSFENFVFETNEIDEIKIIGRTRSASQQSPRTHSPGLKQCDDAISRNSRFLIDVIRRLDVIIGQHRKLFQSQGHDSSRPMDIDEFGEYQILANVINRLFFIVFLIFYLTGTFYIFLM
ncbi:neuronal acetylcholine receptor subunit alpha-6-like [Saccoglossus kowalevskii]|uniref:Neuronal acetylcholine receptor subunit alpha-6-like n=1 Tax=Saccoglossus kowalevskii TaxID=10224 RepID=A0ABM0LVD6_SACKO|nr:PREDICTED: neuronal acetylcholine receptor subunit alpha-6-like [Saccoglossus kowalevskii]